MKVLESLVEFFEIWHLKEVLVIALSHVIINCKFKNIEMMKTICVHLFVGAILTSLTRALIVLVGPVVLGGESDN